MGQGRGERVGGRERERVRERAKEKERENENERETTCTYSTHTNSIILLTLVYSFGLSLATWSNSFLGVEVASSLLIRYSRHVLASSTACSNSVLYWLFFPSSCWRACTTMILWNRRDNFIQTGSCRLRMCTCTCICSCTLSLRKLSNCVYYCGLTRTGWISNCYAHLPSFFAIY